MSPGRHAAVGSQMWPRIVDLRLLAPLAGLWCGCALGPLLDSRAAWAGIAGASLLAAARRLGARRWAAVGLVLALVIGAVAAGAQQARRDADPLALLLSSGDTREGSLEGVLARGSTPLGHGRAFFTLRPDEAVIDGLGPVPTSRPVTVFGPAPAARLYRGERARVRVILHAEGGEIVASARTPASLVGGGRPLVRRAVEAFSSVPDRASGLGLAMTLGLREAVDPALADDMRRSSLSHLAAVSGLHMTHVLGAVLLLAAAAPRRARAVLAAAALLVYGGVVGQSGSVIRAGGMAAVSLLALSSGRPRAAVPALAAAAGVALVCDPSMSRDVGFALSCAATAAIVLFGTPLAHRLARIGLPESVATACALSLLAQLASLPIALLINPGLPLAGLAANLLAAPAIAPALLASLAAVLVASVWPAAGAVVAGLAGWPLRWLAGLAGILGGPASPVLPWVDGPAGLVCALLAVLSGAGLCALWGCRARRAWARMRGRRRVFTGG